MQGRGLKGIISTLRFANDIAVMTGLTSNKYGIRFNKRKPELMATESKPKVQCSKLCKILFPVIINNV